MPFRAPQFSPALFDPVVETYSGPELKGVLIYSPYFNARHYFVFRAFNAELRWNNKKNSFISYDAGKISAFLMNPRASTQANALMWRFDGGSVGVWSWQQNLLWINDDSFKLRGQWALNHYQSHWSPDGRSIAYAKTADARYGVADGSPSNVLRVHDLKTRANRTVFKSFAPYVQMHNPLALQYRTFNWTPRNTLLFNQQQRTAQNEPMPPDIWEINPALKNAPAKPVLTGGTHPFESPDGRYIAFLGWSDTQTSDQTWLQNAPQLWLFDRKTGKRRWLYDAEYGHVEWLEGGRKLLFFDVRALGEGKGRGRLLEFDLSRPDDAMRTVATLEMQDSVENQKRRNQWSESIVAERRGEYFPWLKLSRDQKWAITDIQISADYDEKLKEPIIEHRLTAIHIATGRIITLARSKASSGRMINWDWFDMTGTAPPAQKH